jgi:integrase
MIQQGQVFKLKAKGADGQSLWAYRYRLEGRGSARPQVGGFATRADALKALEKVLQRLGPNGRAATMTLADLVDEYLELHQAEPVTISKLRWLLGKATAALGETRLADLSPKEVYAWRLTIPEGHRFEATQALRQVLNRALIWGLIDDNPAKRGVPNPMRRSKEKRPFESWQQVEAVAAGLGPVYGPMVVFAAATGLRPSELFALEQRDIDRALGVVYVRRAYAPTQAHQDAAEHARRSAPGESARGTQLPTSARELAALPELAWQLHRLPSLRPPPLEAGSGEGRNRAATSSLRPASHLRHLRPPGRGLGVRGLPLHGLEHRNDRPSLRTPRPRQP